MPVKTVILVQVLAKSSIVLPVPGGSERQDIVFDGELPHTFAGFMETVILLSAIEARKNVITLEEVKQRLEQLERDIQSRASSDAAGNVVRGILDAAHRNAVEALRYE